MTVQIAILALLTNVAHVQYLAATAVAVECTVLHNFAWHERFTWADRPSRSRRAIASRLLHFNLTTGAVSIGGNILLMRLLVGAAHAPVLLANLASVATCAVVNYLVNDRWVFAQVGSRSANRTTFECARAAEGSTRRDP